MFAAVLVTLMLAVSASAMKDARADQVDGSRADKISQFNLAGQNAPEKIATDADIQGNYNVSAVGAARPVPNPRRSLGSANSTDVGLGPGVSVDLTYDDWLWGRKHGRYVTHSWNGEVGGAAIVDVHFAYEEGPDSTGDHADPNVYNLLKVSGYNVYDASVPSSNWPRGQDQGCDLQATDTLGTGNATNLDVTSTGRAVIAARSRFFTSLGDGTRLNQNVLFYQGARHNCTYDPRSSLNTSFIDSLTYRPHGMEGMDDGGNYGWDPQVVTSWDGTNDIVHVILGEDNYQDSPGGDDYSTANQMKAFSYYRKVGANSYDGSWSSGVTLDSNWYHSWSLAVGEYPNHDEVAVSFIADSYYGALLNHFSDLDCWIRESHDGGLAWDDSRSITNYTNAIAGDPAHFCCWLESQLLFDLDGNLHAIWIAKPTSDDPYFDGFNWQDFDENIYHWDRASGDIVKIANGNFMNDDMLTGSMNTLHCGFGGVNAGYLAFPSISQCEDRLYVVWNQIHERANRLPWRDAEVQPAPGVIDDCAYDAPRLSAANFDVLMSVAQLVTPSLWDAPRNITDTYTPACGLATDPEAAGPCGSEYKPSVEKYALDESGLSLTWPAGSIVDMSPGGDYAGTSFLNMLYLDDQYPGSFWAQDLRGNTIPTENSMKWVRLACVEPIEASQIRVIPSSIEWPEWVELGQSNAITVTCVNEGNVMLNVTAVTVTETTGSGWLSTDFLSFPWQVTAGVINTRTFDIHIDATGLSATAWLDGEVEITSDAANFPTIIIPIHVLAAAEVEPVVWDTVMTHVNMFDTYFIPEGECVALAVGNNGDLGWGAGSAGLVNLDYVESETECSDRARDGYYLIGASTFTILADDGDGANAMLTQSFNDADQADETGWDPIGTNGSIGGGLAGSGNYDSVYTGVIVNRDTTIAMERVVYGPRSTDPANDTINFVVVHTKMYSGDGAGHNHVTLGNVVDWDVPAELVPENTSGTSLAGFVYMQGTDTTGVLSCQSHTGRYATEAFFGAYLSIPGEACAIAAAPYSVNSLIQTLMVDTTHTRDGVELDPDQPLADVWWDETGNAGLNHDVTVQDQAIWMTYVHDYNLGATDTLNYWTVISTVRDGVLNDLSAQVTYAKAWMGTDGPGGMYPCATGCCVGRVGDANGLGGEEPTIGDISVMIDAKFITGTCAGIIVCLDEADVNQSGPPNAAECDHVTIGDISILIDYLFITGPSVGLADCF